ncbi:hypothetical protein VdG1_00957 [Verticillium dahliae VDG1]|nr:hypothetical protein VdG1_00957 [Verticillium dahliae VDG1]
MWTWLRKRSRPANRADLDNQIATYLNIYSDSHVGTIVVAGPELTPRSRDATGTPLLAHRCSLSERYHDSLQKRLIGTGDWILDRPAFLHWVAKEYSTGPKLLWVNRPTGFGKTILCARVVKHLSSIPETLSPILILTFNIAFDTSIFPGERH